MEVSELIESTTHASASPNGHYIAGLTSEHVYVYYTTSLSLAASFPLDTANTPVTRSNETPTLHWTPSSLGVILQTSGNVSLFSLANTNSRLRIANGSAGLGRIAAVDVLGENVVVVWEFGRVGVFEVGRGRVTEVGELKTGIGSLRAAWSVRRVDDKAEVLAMLSRTSATDTLSLLLPNATTPFTTTALSTTDAQSLSWSPTGTWLSILDTPLSTPNPSIHIYTADGNLFRHFPRTPTQDQDELSTLGPLRQVWGCKHLALANADGTIALLDTRTFSLYTVLDPADCRVDSAYREIVNAKGERSWTYLASGDENTSQTLSSHSAAQSLTFNTDATFLAARSEANPETAMIWHVPAPSPLSPDNTEEQQSVKVLHHHSAIRKFVWHPTLPSLLLMHTEDNTLCLFDVTSDTAPTLLTHPFPPAEITIVSWLSSSTSLLLTTRKRGWLLIHPFGRAETISEIPASPATTEKAEDDSQDSLYDILSGRTPLPALKIGDGGQEDFEQDTVSEGLDDTFRGKGTVGTVESFEY